MPQILPIKELKNTAEISNICHTTDEPIYITKNGYGDMVIMSMNTYDAYFNLLNTYRNIEISEKQIKDGHVKDAKKMLDVMRNQYGL